MARATTVGSSAGWVLAASGWDVEGDGLLGAPPVSVLAGEFVHYTVGKAVRILGLGESRMIEVAADDNARMRPDALADALAGIEGSAIVCAQAGEIATGGIDPLAAIADVVDARRAQAPTWLHIDGAIVRDREAHHRAMTLHASYLPQPGAARDPIDWNPEMSRRARATAVYATLRSLGRSGGTTFRAHAAIRFSIANWARDADDVKQTVSALALAHGGAV